MSSLEDLLLSFITGIRQLQCILMKVALIVGVEIHVNVSFDGLIEPAEEDPNGTAANGVCCYLSYSLLCLLQYKIVCLKF